MNETPQQLRQILNSANALVRDIIVETDRAVNTPTQEWTVFTRQHALKTLRAKATVASDAFRKWIEQGVSISRMGKIYGCLAVIGTDAFHASLTDSRTNGRARLRQDLQSLIGYFGAGCELENPVPPIEEVILTPQRDEQIPQTPRAKPRVDPEEQPYKLRELAILHGVNYMTALRWYENEPGVLIHESSPEHQRKIGRRYRTIRVPPHVYRRVRARLENR